MAERLTGARVDRLRRRSKYILADLDRRDADHPPRHVGADDDLGRRPAPGHFHHDHPAPEKHDHVVLDMEAGARVTFNDARRFGAMDLMPDRSGRRATGCWPTSGPNRWATPSTRITWPAARGPRTPVKAALLDQRIVAGLGNIYVCEALFRAGISPLAKPAASPAPASRGW
jgi:formamidopyrimidine-DNA glycosylase